MDTNKRQYNGSIRLCGILPCNGSQGGDILGKWHKLSSYWVSTFDRPGYSGTLHLTGGSRKESGGSCRDREVRGKTCLWLGNRDR